MKYIAIILCVFINSAYTVEIIATGVVESKKTQNIMMPQVRSFNGKISEMAEEGSFVEKGDMVMRVDGSDAFNKIESQQESLDVFKATSERDLIDLKIQKNDASVAYERAKVKKKVAAVKAKVPVNFIGELEYKERQLALKQAEKDLGKTEDNLNEVLKKENEKKLEIKLGLEQKQKSLQYWKNKLDSYTVKAKQSGYVIYGTHNWTGNKFQTGDQVQSGFEIMKVSQNDNMQITTWINAIDVPSVKLSQTANITFDALPDIQTTGTIDYIAEGGADKKDWGNGLYYEVIINIEPENQPSGLLSGMSAMIKIHTGG